SVVFFVYYISVEKTKREDGSQSVVLVDDNYQIVEEVALFLNYLEKRGRSINTIENYCRNERMKEVLYKFNEYFAGRGWIAFESLNTKLMEKCVELADKGELEEAEEELLNYYFDRERIDFLIRRLIYFKDFQPRKELFKKALDDHFNERFHSSVPIFLMMI